MTQKGHYLHCERLLSGLHAFTTTLCPRPARRHVMALLSGLLILLTAALASAASLTDISLHSAGQGRDVVRLTFDGAINVPQSTMLSAPQRLVLECHRQSSVGLTCAAGRRKRQ